MLSSAQPSAGLLVDTPASVPVAVKLVRLETGPARRIVDLAAMKRHSQRGTGPSTDVLPPPATLTATPVVSLVNTNSDTDADNLVPVMMALAVSGREKVS